MMSATYNKWCWSVVIYLLAISSLSYTSCAIRISDEQVIEEDEVEGNDANKSEVVFQQQVVAAFSDVDASKQFASTPTENAASMLSSVTNGYKPTPPLDFDAVALSKHAVEELPAKEVAVADEEKTWLQRQILELQQRLEKVKKQEQGVAQSELGGGVLSYSEPIRHHQRNLDAIEDKKTSQANPETVEFKEDAEKQKADGALTVAWLKEMLSDLHNTIQDQHDSLKQKVDLQHEHLKQLMQRQEHMIAELRESRRELAERRVMYHEPTFVHSAPKTQRAKQSLFEVGQEQGDPKEVFEKTVKFFQAFNNGGALGLGIHVLQEGWEGFKDQAVELKKRFPNWQWFAGQISKAFTFFLSGQAYTLVEQARIDSSDLWAESLYQITMGLVQQASDIIPDVIKGWVPTFDGMNQIMGLWIQSRTKIAFGDRHMPIMKDFTQHLMKAYESWRMERGPKVISHVLRLVRWFFCEVTVKSDIRAFQLFGNMFCGSKTEGPEVVPRPPGCTEEEAQKHSTNAQDFPQCQITESIPLGCNETEALEHLVNPKVNPHCQTLVRPPGCTELEALQHRDNHTVNLHCQTPRALARPDDDSTPKPSTVAKGPQMPNAIQIVIEKFKAFQGWTETFSWPEFKRKIGQRVDAMFHPLFYQVGVPIAANIRLALSQAFCDFTIDLLLEIINLSPLLNVPLKFVSDDSAISVIHSWGNALLLQPVFESSHMEDLEQKIKDAYSDFLGKSEDGGFKNMVKEWIVRSYQDIKGMGLTDDEREEVRHVESEQARTLKDYPGMVWQGNVKRERIPEHCRRQWAWANGSRQANGIMACQRLYEGIEQDCTWSFQPPAKCWQPEPPPMDEG